MAICKIGSISHLGKVLRSVLPLEVARGLLRLMKRMRVQPGGSQEWEDVSQLYYIISYYIILYHITSYYIIYSIS